MEIGYNIVQRKVKEIERINKEFRIEKEEKKRLGDLVKDFEKTKIVTDKIIESLQSDKEVLKKDSEESQQNNYSRETDVKKSETKK